MDANDARIRLEEAGVLFSEHNAGAHFKIGRINFWPSTGKWNDGDTRSRGLEELLKHIKSGKSITEGSVIKPRYLSADQIFDVAKKCKERDLTSICDAIHKAIYQ